MIIYGKNDTAPVNLDNIDALITRLPLPDEEPLFAFAVKRDNAIDFFRYFCEIFQRSGTEFEETILSTYNINQDAAELLKHCRENNFIGGRTYVLFNGQTLRLGDDRPRFIRQALDAAPGLEWAIGNVHAKLQLYKSGSHHFVVEGSGNLAENSNLEFYTVHNSRRLYAFRRSVIMSFFGVTPRMEAPKPEINLNHIGGQ